MNIAGDRPIGPYDDDQKKRLETLNRATARRVRLEALFADRAFLDKTLSDGRYLRLCAVIAWASEREEEARERVGRRTFLAA